MELSTCCDAQKWVETDICSSCKEHADFYDDEESEGRLNEELKVGRMYAKQLVRHLNRMGAEESLIPVEHEGVKYEITVKALP